MSAIIQNVEKHKGARRKLGGEAATAVSATALALAAPALKNTKLVCSKCGATGQSGCECGEQFLKYANSTRKADQVAEALRDPGNAAKSDRAIAADLGVAPNTVGNARKATAQNCAVDEKRMGRDGKARKAPGLIKPVKKATTSDDDPYETVARDFVAECDDGAWRTLSKMAAVVRVADSAAREALKRLDAADRVEKRKSADGVSFEYRVKDKDGKRIKSGREDWRELLAAKDREIDDLKAQITDLRKQLAQKDVELALLNELTAPPTPAIGHCRSSRVRSRPGGAKRLDDRCSRHCGNRQH
jgi:hypothetical protein